MVSSSSTGSSALLFGYVIAEKLNKTNYSLWKAQVLPILRGAQLQEYLDDTNVAPNKMIEGKTTGDKPEATQEVNLEYIQWSAMEKQVLNFLLMSVTRDVMAQVSSCATPREVWTLLEQTYASRSKARVVNTRMALATTQKGNMSISEYIAKMKSFADEMASVGKPLEEEELVSYILAGLDFDYNSIVSTIEACMEPIFVGELYSQLMSFEAR
jgi:glutathionylspermidine synthase